MAIKRLGILRNPDRYGSSDGGGLIVPTSVTLWPPTPWLNLGQAPFQMQITIDPPEADQGYSIFSVDPDIATITATGLVTTVALGYADIVVVTKTGGLYDTSEVWVKEPAVSYGPEETGMDNDTTGWMYYATNCIMANTIRLVKAGRIVGVRYLTGVSTSDSVDSRSIRIYPEACGNVLGEIITTGESLITVPTWMEFNFSTPISFLANEAFVCAVDYTDGYTWKSPPTFVNPNFAFVEGRKYTAGFSVCPTPADTFDNFCGLDLVVQFEV